MVSQIQTGTTLFELENGRYVEWYVVDLVWSDDGVSAILSHGDRRATVDADELEAAVVDESPTWVPSMYEQGDDGELEPIPHPNHSDADADGDDVDVDLRVAPDSPTDLSFERMSGRGSRTEVNNFLEGGDDGLVNHELGGVSSWKTAFVARHDDAIVSAIVLHHYHPSTNGVEIAITRVANHPSAPKNTSSWVVARAREWAKEAGYERIATYAGVGGNAGVCYQAAGFEKAGEPVEVDGKNWSDDHHGSDESSSWTKQKYVYEFERRETPDVVESEIMGTCVESTISAARDVADVDEISGKTVGAAIAASV
jgi:hypothetical protein